MGETLGKKNIHLSIQNLILLPIFYRKRPPKSNYFLLQIQIYSLFTLENNGFSFHTRLVAVENKNISRLVYHTNTNALNHSGFH